MKILMIACEFPPYGGIEPRRVAYYAKHLAEQGHEVVVSTANTVKEYPLQDPDILRILPPKVRVVRFFPGITYWLRYRYLESARTAAPRLPGVLFFVDFLIRLGNLGWFPWGLLSARRLIKSGDFDVIYSFGNPFTCHLIAACLKSEFKVPWVAEYGDPWTLRPASQARMGWIRRLERRLEDACCRRMDRVIVRTALSKKGYLNTYPCLTEDKVSVIAGGVDVDLYSLIEAETSAQFRIVFTGKFYDHMNYIPLLDAMTRLAGEQIEMVFCGKLPEAFRAAVEQRGLTRTVQLLGHQSLRRVVGLQKGADALVVFGWPGGYQVNFKVFEYLTAGRPIVLVSDDPMDAARPYVLGSGRGSVVGNNTGAIEAAFRALYAAWKACNGKRDMPITPAQQFSWEALGTHLERIMLAAHE
jgi:glycosyltransferase involved in cell wall biosynthesis